MWPGLAMWLQDVFHIRLRKIVADEEQTTTGFALISWRLAIG
jgi:hypothetical protein